jgi:hypothetical protein
MCPRNIHGGIENPLLNLNDWTYKDFVTIFNEESLKQINAILFCGNFGDPVLNNDLPKMCQYLKESNENIFVGIYTNGSIRSVQWWKDLINYLPPNHEINFALDGLEDTHSIYRIGTDYNKILDNAKAFIESGGIANWVFIKFKHNQHQIEQAKTISEKLGFKEFMPKNSKRFGKNFPVIDRNGSILYHIEQNTHSTISHVEHVDLVDYKNWKKATEIDCFADATKELYIDAHFNLMPCCMIASFIHTNYDRSIYEKYDLIDESSIIDIGKVVQTEILSLVEEFGGFHSLNAKQHGIKKIMDSEVWQELIKSKWANKQSSACIILCSKDSPYIKTNDQWISDN